MPKVSVIIPCFNLGQYLNDAVDSVLAQTFQDFEIIIVNDGSIDEFTNRLLTDYIRPKTRVLKTSNQGLPAARNNGIKESSGQYICCLDADDRYHETFLEKSLAVLENDTTHDYGFVTTWVQFFGIENHIWKTIGYEPNKLAYANLIHVASLFRRECWEKKGGYSTNLSGYQDWDFWIALTALGYKWYCIEEPLFFYRRRDNSMVQTSDKKRPELIRQIINNNRDFFSNRLTDIVLEAAQLFANDNYNRIIIAEKERQLSEKDKHINKMRETLSWKTTAPLRRFYNLFKVMTGNNP